MAPPPKPKSTKKKKPKEELEEERRLAEEVARLAAEGETDTLCINDVYVGLANSQLASAVTHTSTHQSASVWRKRSANAWQKSRDSAWSCLMCF